MSLQQDESTNCVDAAAWQFHRHRTHSGTVWHGLIGELLTQSLADRAALGVGMRSSNVT